MCKFCSPDMMVCLTALLLSSHWEIYKLKRACVIHNECFVLQYIVFALCSFSLWIIWCFTYILFRKHRLDRFFFSFKYTHFSLRFCSCPCVEAVWKSCRPSSRFSFLLRKHIQVCFGLCNVGPLEVKWVFPCCGFVFVAWGLQRTNSVSTPTQKVHRQQDATFQASKTLAVFPVNSLITAVRDFCYHLTTSCSSGCLIILIMMQKY